MLYQIWLLHWTMKKIKLILQPDQFTSFTAYFLEDFWRKFFDIEIYDATKTYPTTGTLFAFWWMNANDDLPKRLRDQGYKVSIDRLWEYPEHNTDFYWIEHSDWFRLNESLWWRAMNYDRYVPHKKQNLKLALMPVRRENPDRTYFVTKLESLLENMIWSYKEKKLPDDGDPESGDYQRFVNPNWYDETFCSVVIETRTNHKITWITEKTCKPLAFYHPFLIVTAPGHLAKLKNLGFETFDNLFDESYDQEIDFKKRCEIIKNNLHNLEPGKYDRFTQQKLLHNHEHFFNQTLVESIIENEIVNPLLEYANA